MHIDGTIKGVRSLASDAAAHLCDRCSSGLAALCVQQRASIAASLPVRHAAEKARLLSHYERSMRQWYLSLSSGGFNLLCYGYGSKKHLLTHFARVWLTDAPVIVFNAYTPGANVKVVRNALMR